MGQGTATANPSGDETPTAYFEFLHTSDAGRADPWQLSELRRMRWPSRPPAVGTLKALRAALDSIIPDP